MNVNTFPKNASFTDQIAFLLHYVILAPSAFNSQPWRFEITEDKLLFLPDFTRWYSFADAEQRQLYISLGCALENLHIAASFYGLKMQIEGNPDGLAISFSKKETPGLKEFFNAIPARTTYYGSFEKTEIEASKINSIKNEVKAPFSLQISNDQEILKAIEALCLRIDIIQFADANYRKGLSRIFEDGLLDSTLIIQKLGEFAAHLQGKTIPFKGAPFFCCLMGKESNPQTWIEAGRIFERIYLTCTMLGLKIKPINSGIIEPKWRQEFQTIFSSFGQIPLQPFIIGYGNEKISLNKKKRSLRDMLYLDVKETVIFG